VLAPKAVRDNLFKRRAAKLKLSQRLRISDQRQRLHELDLHSPAALRTAFESLRQRGIRLLWEYVNALPEQGGHEPI
jgi:hypothetical protein